LSLAKFLEKSHSDRETNTVADMKKKKKWVVLRLWRRALPLSPGRAARISRREICRDLKWYEMKSERFDLLLYKI